MLEKIKEILAEQLNCDADTITEDSDFIDDLGADSLDLMELVMALEDEYGVEIDTTDLSEIKTVGVQESYYEAVHAPAVQELPHIFSARGDTK